MGSKLIDIPIFSLIIHNAVEPIWPVGLIKEYPEQ
jgi:hypothetical protein